MHPFIEAYIVWKKCVDLNIRQQSLYYTQWLRMCEERERFLLEVTPSVCRS